MIRARDVREAIAEQSSGVREQKALEAVADALSRSLADDVPYRPEFKAALRDRLMTQARRSVSPWYRRPAVVWPSVAAAAAAVVLAVGLQLYSSGLPGKVAEGPRPSDRTDKTSRNGDTLVSNVIPPAVALPDETLLPGQTGPAPMAGVDLNNLKLYFLTGRANADQFSRMARALGFGGQPVSDAGGYTAREATRSLGMKPDGYVVYRDWSSADNPAGSAVMDPTAVRSIALNFLVQALLPVPGLEPAVLEGAWENHAHAYTVIYTPQVDGRPVVNARTVVRLSDQGRVLAAEGYAQTGMEAKSPYTAMQPTAAIDAAQQQGGATFTQADLVYARTTDAEAIYLQPYWRVFGTRSNGERMVRYVPALTVR